jgi:hypothetical protein
MSTIPNTPVLNKVLAQNAKAKTDAGIIDQPNFSMAHPQKLSQQGLTDLLATFDLNNPTKQSNGLVRGNTLDGSSYFMTPGVIKFKPGQTSYPSQPQPPVYYGDGNPVYYGDGNPEEYENMNSYLA